MCEGERPTATPKEGPVNRKSAEVGPARMIDRCTRLQPICPSTESHGLITKRTGTRPVSSELGCGTGFTPDCVAKNSSLRASRSMPTYLLKKNAVERCRFHG